MNYVNLKIVRLIASSLAMAEEHGLNPGCEAEKPGGEVCAQPIEYLIPKATRPGGGGQDIEIRPATVCRGCLEEMLGHAPEEQPLFRRLVGPSRGE